MENLNLIKPEKVQNIINKFCYTIGMIPTSYKMSLTYEEQILAIGHYLETTVYPAINNNAEALAELQNLFLDLKNYVDNYFENLDVQVEINNKLDEMAQNGELQEMITAYLQLQGLIVYNNVEDMKKATNLTNGSFVKTYGFYDYKKGGGSYYKVRNIRNDDVVDEMFLIPLHDKSLVAELVVDTEINIKQLGAKTIDEDNSYDNTEIIQKAIDYINSKNGGNVLIPSGTFKVIGTLKLKEYANIIGQGNSSRLSEKATTIFHNPSTSTNLFESDDVTDDNYKGYYSIKNICLYGNGASNIALLLNNTLHSIFENINI